MPPVTPSADENNDGVSAHMAPINAVGQLQEATDRPRFRHTFWSCGSCIDISQAFPPSCRVFQGRPGSQYGPENVRIRSNSHRGDGYGDKETAMDASRLC
ncbi:hypothetical protein L198_05417 [Cryptococcus wingfieldii CBS 7118]|uniref:Uncharacterized protein n=1 Tax=Cryptococcus wingfieldii CBS 7118 TaxID=1295528 RepID=A0A1E3IYA2_9TREE|nr:hypothetical protein L198_05417 [Cryptococcus wingfieldii CBS 7118]ODN93552.1 hypothetical protein L198_05417 [Cryptococcus wingfieldii CBS 7118]